MKSRPSPDSGPGLSGQPPLARRHTCLTQQYSGPSPAQWQCPESIHGYSPQLSRMLYTTRASQKPREVSKGFELGGTEFQPCICQQLAV